MKSNYEKIIELISHSSLHGWEPSGVIASICLARPLPFIGRGLFFLHKFGYFFQLQILSKPENMGKLHLKEENFYGSHFIRICMGFISANIP